MMTADAIYYKPALLGISDLNTARSKPSPCAESTSLRDTTKRVPSSIFKIHSRLSNFVTSPQLHHFRNGAVFSADDRDSYLLRQRLFHTPASVVSDDLVSLLIIWIDYNGVSAFSSRLDWISEALD